MIVDTGTVDAGRHRVEIELVRGLVAVPSLSRHEAAASGWLADQMAARGLERCHVDGALNAVGELGDPAASRLVVLLGHIDTVPGNIPVRIEDDGSPHGILHGRGSVDAKGPLASFVAAAARLGGDWARAHDLRVIVAGATEEEAATSRGAHFLLKRLNGRDEPAPDFCIIGEPSHWHRVTLGYKGRLLIDLMARRPSSHTAGPEVGVGITAFDLWRRLEQVAERHGGRTPFERVLPSLRSIGTTSDGLYDTVRADYGLRLPVDFDVSALVDELTELVRRRGGGHRRAAVLGPRPGARHRHDPLRAGARRPGTQPARLRDRGPGRPALAPGPRVPRRHPRCRRARRSRRSSSSRRAPAT